MFFLTIINCKLIITRSILKNISLFQEKRFERDHLILKFIFYFIIVKSKKINFNIQNQIILKKSDFNVGYEQMGLLKKLILTS